MKAFFLPARRGDRFCVLHEVPATVGVRGSVLFVQPFAEEMNQSRRMAALQARAFAAAGWTTLQLDLFGCGDSEGDFAEAHWDDWVSDIVSACEWLRNETGEAPVLWGLRTGCLIAAEAAQHLPAPPRFVFWQPVLSGDQHLRQFLRLKAVSDLMGAGAGKPAGPDAKAMLARGETIEIAGYRMSAALASAMRAAKLEIGNGKTHIIWIEVRTGGGSIAPPSRAKVEALCAAGHCLHARAVDGPAFWQIPAAPDCHPLIDATLYAMHMEQGL